MNSFWCKANVKRFGFNNLHQDLDIMRIVHTVRLYLLFIFVIYILFAPDISTSIHRCVNNSNDINVLMKVIKTETFNIGFHQNKLI